MEKSEIVVDLKNRMESSMKVLDHEFKGLRTGRASVNFLDPVSVDAYGSFVSITQIANVTCSTDGKIINVQVWDKTLVKPVEKAIADANLGLNPVSDGQNIKITIPTLTQQRREEIVKIANKYAENIKVSIRNVRREGMDQLKKQEKDKVISKDEHHDLSENIQKVTDSFIKRIDDALKKKKYEIMEM